MRPSFIPVCFSEWERSGLAEPAKSPPSPSSQLVTPALRLEVPEPRPTRGSEALPSRALPRWTPVFHQHTSGSKTQALGTASWKKVLRKLAALWCLELRRRVICNPARWFLLLPFMVLLKNKSRAFGNQSSHTLDKKLKPQGINLNACKCSCAFQTKHSKAGGVASGTIKTALEGKQRAGSLSSELQARVSERSPPWVTQPLPLAGDILTPKSYILRAELSWVGPGEVRGWPRFPPED